MDIIFIVEREHALCAMVNNNQFVKSKTSEVWSLRAIHRIS